MGRRLGQHFLKNKGKIKEIADSLELERGDFVIEIGPGHGELTNELRSMNNELRIVAVEKDKLLAGELKNRLENEDVEIIHGDALKLLPSIIHDSRFMLRGYKVAGNIPYYITGKLFRILGDLVTGGMRPHTTPLISLIVFTVQKEVAERIAAKPPKMNLLAASVQFWAEPEIIDFISKKDFKPQPEVDSAIIRLRTKDYESEIKDDYYKLVKILFKQPRKTILNNLQAGLGSSRGEIVRGLGEAGINPADRPQNLKIKEISDLARLF